MYKKITNCTDWKIVGKCKNDNLKMPLAMNIPDKCRIMLVSQAPSRKASEQQILCNSANTTYIQILKLLGISNQDFEKYVYWTHYGKCYPGSRKGGDQWPTVYCANKFIADELSICKERGCSLVVGIAEPCSKYLYTRFVEPSMKISNIFYKDIRNKVFSIDEQSWLFIKHPAATANWSKNLIDNDFIEEILKLEVKKALSSL